LILPKNGFGTGYAQLDQKAPKTYQYLLLQLKKLIEELDPGSSEKFEFLNVK